MAKSAAELWCPYCEEIHPCYSVNASDVGVVSGRQFSFKGADDVHFVKRHRKCTNCDMHFVTAEVGEEFLDELVRLRRTLSEIRAKISAYDAEAKKAAATLKELGKSLTALGTF